MYAVISALFIKLWPWVLGAVWGVVGYFMIKKSGADKARAQDAAKHAQAVSEMQDKARKADDTINRLDDGGVADKLESDWMRRPGNDKP